MAAFKLNPNAKEWQPSIESPVENRSLYMTFSNGYPLSEFQIYRFFMARQCEDRGFGAYVEKIDIHQPRDIDYPLFGKITFKLSCVPALILNGEEKVKYCIDGRTVWCKKYNRKANVEA
ncbi:hypothetical protein RHGRI_001355 [Rhododendron griersonianum]|uniref:Uncharacterized protein n=1 Tax=Rhododendron griersonianum TaxID=479676 RepID=A0AAV6LJY5_9ERIC|nr:hypothetical protein RHGRI_001355 [Rhododendron griersonianum]